MPAVTKVEAPFSAPTFTTCFQAYQNALVAAAAARNVVPVALELGGVQPGDTVVEIGPGLGTLTTARIVNIAAATVDEYAAVLERLDAEPGVDAYEINISCPNVKEGGLSFGTSVPMTTQITKRLRPLTKKALILKLTPNVTNVGEFARAAEGEGADAVSLINTLVGMAVDVRTRRPKLSTVTGGLSGPAIKPIALAKVYEAARAVNRDIIVLCHGGPIAEPEDAAFIFERTTGIDGFFGASSMERLPTEVAMTENMRRFKALTVNEG